MRATGVPVPMCCQGLIAILSIKMFLNINIWIPNTNISEPRMINEHSQPYYSSMHAPAGLSVKRHSIDFVHNVSVYKNKHKMVQRNTLPFAVYTYTKYALVHYPCPQNHYYSTHMYLSCSTYMNWILTQVPCYYYNSILLLGCFTFITLYPLIY